MRDQKKELRDDQDDMSRLIDLLRYNESEARVLSPFAPKRRYSRREKLSFIKQIIEATLRRIHETCSETEVIIKGERKETPGFSLGAFEVIVDFAGQKRGDELLMDNSIEVWFADAGKIMNVHWLDDQIETCCTVILDNGKVPC